MDIIEQFKAEQVKAIERPSLKSGDMVRVHSQITEGKKTRNQIFEGTVLGIRGSGPSRMVTVRRISSGFSVERLFPLYSPLVKKIEVVRRQKVRRARLTYLRQDTKKRRVKEESEDMIAETAPSDNAVPDVSFAPAAEPAKN